MLTDAEAGLGLSLPRAVTVDAVFERYRPALYDALSRSLANRTLSFYDILRYHLGMDNGASNHGKALRPTLCLLVCEALRGNWTKGLSAAISIELIHNFSLIHDDIQDGDRERRHRPAVWVEWGIPQAINAGDAMFCLATLALTGLRSKFDDSLVVEVMRVIQEATGQMIEGQYLDVSYENETEITLDDYLRMIARKTGALLRVSVEVGAVLAGASDAVRLSCRNFGEAVGRLFQIRDDMLGVWGKSETTGKPVDSDIRRKKKSLPIIVALANAGPSERRQLLDIYNGPIVADQEVSRVLEIFDRLGTQSRVQAMANQAHDQAVTLCEDIDFSQEGRNDLMHLLNFLLDREY